LRGIALLLRSESQERPHRRHFPRCGRCAEPGTTPIGKERPQIGRVKVEQGEPTNLLAKMAPEEID
jgi:hypothetical protein